MPSEPAAPNVQPHALVTGSSSGIGEAIARHLLAEGWRVSGLDLAPPRIVGPHFHPVLADLSDGDAAETAARQCEAGAGPVQALVHAAGVLRVGALGAEGSSGPRGANDAALMWRLHVAAASRLAEVLGLAMARRGQGRIVLVGSRVAQGKAGRAQYAASKAALVALARSWAAELVTQGVTVNVVSPAATQTAMLDDPARAMATPVLPPIGRLIRPDEIASLVAYLLGPAAAAITGQEITICGGASLPR